jgi:hypothetical protein
MAKMGHDDWVHVMTGLGAGGTLMAATVVNDNDLLQVSLGVLAGFCFLFAACSFRPTRNALLRLQDGGVLLLERYAFRKWETSQIQHDNQVLVRIHHREDESGLIFLCDVFRKTHRVGWREALVGRINLRGESGMTRVRAVSEREHKWPDDFGGKALLDGRYRVEWRALIRLRGRQYKPIIGRSRFKVRGGHLL